MSESIKTPQNVENDKIGAISKDAPSFSDSRDKLDVEPVGRSDSRQTESPRTVLKSAEDRNELRQRMQRRITAMRDARNGTQPIVTADVSVASKPSPSVPEPDRVMRSRGVLNPGDQLVEGVHALVLLPGSDSSDPGKVGLISERSGKKFGLVGGKVESGESVREALKREATEELGTGPTSAWIIAASSNAKFFVSEAVDNEKKILYRCNYFVMQHERELDGLTYYPINPVSLSDERVEEYVSRVLTDAGKLNITTVRYKTSDGDVPVKVEVRMSAARPEWLESLVSVESEYTQKIRVVDQNLKKLIRNFMVMSKFQDDHMVLSNPPTSLTYDMSSDCKLVGDLELPMKQAIIRFFDSMTDLNCVKCNNKKFDVARSDEEFKVKMRCICSWSDIWESGPSSGGGGRLTSDSRPQP